MVKLHEIVDVFGEDIPSGIDKYPEIHIKEGPLNFDSNTIVSEK